MKKLLLLPLIVVVVVVIMYVFRICPPIGPWPMPPWCKVKTVDLGWTESLPTKNSGLVGRIGIEMMDTWGRNYNFSMVENTRDNIDSSFERISKIGAKKVLVNDFYRAVYEDKEYNRDDTNYKIEKEIFLNDFRDESMSDEDLKKLANSAKKNGLQIGWRTSFHFWDIGKYLKPGTDISESVKKDFTDFRQPKTGEWVVDFLGKYKELMVDRAKKLKDFGFDFMILTPGYMTPEYKPFEETANKLWKEIYSEVKKVFGGEVGYLVSDYTFVEGINDSEWQANNDFWKVFDRVWVAFYELPQSYKNGESEVMLDKYLDDLENGLRVMGTKASLIVRVNSYKDSIKNGLVELLDINNVVVRSLNADEEYQQKYLNKFFARYEKSVQFQDILVTGYWWDDRMDPEVKVPISKTGSIRNKKAEATFLQWAK